jgi:transcriptional regulator with XRE-family HTH domain
MMKRVPWLDSRHTTAGGRSRPACLRAVVVFAGFFRPDGFCANLHIRRDDLTTSGVTCQAPLSGESCCGGVDVQYGFIERLRELVDYVGGQKELERVSGVDQTTISAWLKRAKNPKFQTVKKIGDATGFCAEWLYLGTGPKRLADDAARAAEATSIDAGLLAEIIEHVENALAMRREEYRMQPHDKARVIALEHPSVSGL